MVRQCAVGRMTTLEGDQMKYRTFGRMGWKVSDIGFGAWAIGGGWGKQDDADSIAALNRAGPRRELHRHRPGLRRRQEARVIAEVLKHRPNEQDLCRDQDPAVIARGLAAVTL